MEKLFIYYSYTGNGDVVADFLKEKEYEIRQVVRKKKLPKSFFWGIMTGGFLAGIHHKDKLVGFDANIEEYDEIMIGSPIWNGRISSPVNMALSILKQNGLSSKKVSFIFYAGSGEGKKALKRINKEFPEAKVFFLKEPKKYPEELEKLGKRLVE